MSSEIFIHSKETREMQELEEVNVCKHEGCNRTYKSRFSLKRHQLSHMKIRNHKCPYCGKGFSLAQYLREHVHIHTGARPFLCPYPGCGKRFRQAGKLSIHKKEHSSMGNPENKSEQTTPSHNEAISNLQAVQAVINQLRNFTIPNFFFSKVLPLPEQVKTQKETMNSLSMDYAKFKRKSFVYYPAIAAPRLKFF